MNKIDVLFIDLLYQQKGSFDDDFSTISKALDGSSIFHLKVESGKHAGALFRVISAIFQLSPRKVVFLSAKIWQLILLSPLSLLRPTYAVYHFRPNLRAKLHDRVLPLLSRLYALAAYSESVKKYLATTTGQDIPIVASRLINKRQSIELLTNKLGQSKVCIFCPGIRLGVRMPMDYAALREGVEQALSQPVEKLVIQESNRQLQTETGVSAYVPPMLSESEYARFYEESLIIAMMFHPGYEARSSAMINDALGKGCIVVTEAHPITIQYGYPTGLVTNLKHLPLVVEGIRNGSIGVDQIPGFDYIEAKKSWLEFLKLDA